MVDLKKSAPDGTTLWVVLLLPVDVTKTDDPNEPRDEADKWTAEARTLSALRDSMQGLPKRTINPDRRGMVPSTGSETLALFFDEADGQGSSSS